MKAWMAVLVLSCLSASFAKADTLPASPITLLDHSQLVSGSFGYALEFYVPAAGTLALTLSDLIFPESLSTLNFAVPDGDELLTPTSVPGYLSFDVSTPGKYFAFVWGQTQGALNLGAYSLNVKWTALPTAVPLPAAGWLLASGVAGLLGLARRRREVAQN